jgi:hypothetical protein
VVLLAACNQAFGLERTRIVDSSVDAYVDVDEDGDSIRNDIDNCPGIYNPLQEDRDHDGVGDACDPHPDTPGDTIAATAFFNVGFDGWTPDAVANWSVHDGAIYSTPPSDGTVVRVSMQLSAPRPTLEVGFTVVAYGSAQDYNQASFELAFPGDAMTCIIGSTGPVDPIQYVVIDTGVGTPQGVTAIQPGAVNRLTYTREPPPGSDSCTLDGTPATLQTGMPLASAQLTASISTGEQLAIQYIVIYAVP